MQHSTLWKGLPDRETWRNYHFHKCSAKASKNVSWKSSCV